ncbi:hypothetical protein LWI29_024876 [Acer saccharum]|uniref:Splicing factor SF3a60 /Prp9 subunit C-terminal domain-containing protein n=1 Tax=Acer saccharum TaxID=4024 RepID=A0AA39SU10_ACESA|nr:hypothetical protein LWI29_024876 [Acer saccharum]
MSTAKKMKMKMATKAGWSGLDDLALEDITGRMTLYRDFASLRMVCTSWRSSLQDFKFKCRMPWLMIPPKQGTNLREFFIFPQVEQAQGGMITQQHLWEEKLGGPKTNKKLKFCCEICGYCHWNRNAFEEHSMSRSHVEGLGDREDKELFKGITKLEEANGLYIAQIKRSVDFLWNPEFEEFEDEDGNLFTKKFTHRYVQNEQDKSWKEVVEVEREYK